MNRKKIFMVATLSLIFLSASLISAQAENLDENIIKSEISGPVNVKLGDTCEYSIVVDIPEENKFFIGIQWQNDTEDEYTRVPESIGKFLEPGEQTVSASHTWTKRPRSGKYTVVIGIFTYNEDDIPVRYNDEVRRLEVNRQGLFKLFRYKSIFSNNILLKILDNLPIFNNLI